MLGQAIGGLLPAAVAVALSPIPIVAVVLVLGSPRARSSGPTFTLGWVAGLTVVSVLVLLIAGGADDPDSTASNLADWLKVGIGVLFLVLAVKQWRNRTARGQEPEMPGWMATIETVAPGRALLLGATLSGANPKNLALTMAAAASIAQADLSMTDEIIAVGVFVLIGSVTVAGSVLFYLLDAERAAGPLSSVRRFMSENNAVIMMVILLLLGAKLIGDGLAGLQA